ncbi:MAG: RNA polymerase sigma factor [Acidimicrobiales bacterium]
MGRGGREVDQEPDELADWLRLGYATAYRTAYGLLRNRTDAEDAVQEAFLRAWRFRAAVPSGEGVQPWLYRVVVNACLSKLRRDGRYRATVVSMGDGGTTPMVGTGRAGTGRSESDPEDRAVERVTHDLVLDALADLPEHLRVVVVLRYYSALSEREIATVIHRRPGTVKSRMHEARTRLSADGRLVDLARVGDRSWP